LGEEEGENGWKKGGRGLSSRSIYLGRGGERGDGGGKDESGGARRLLYLYGEGGRGKKEKGRILLQEGKREEELGREGKGGGGA